jgi:hypothetical protein
MIAHQIGDNRFRGTPKLGSAIANPLLNGRGQFDGECHVRIPC